MWPVIERILSLRHRRNFDRTDAPKSCRTTLRCICPYSGWTHFVVCLQKIKIKGEVKFVSVLKLRDVFVLLMFFFFLLFKSQKQKLCDTLREYFAIVKCVLSIYRN